MRKGTTLLLDCYSRARVTKSTGNKPGKNDVFTNLFCIDYATERNTDLNRKEPVRLRQRRIKNGGYSLYLDAYWNGKRFYDFLKLHLNPPTDDLAIIENKTTLELARQIKYKRILELQTGPTTAYERRIIERNPANLARPIRAENAMREFACLPD